jgi:ADP-ribose pyrophosphatase YjhB (NUDIX family)
MPHHYQEPALLRRYRKGRHPTPPGQLPTDRYSQALDHLVIACTDILLTHQTQIFLAKRQTLPRPSWWIIGGRMRAGESPLVAAQRKLLEEVALDIHRDRLQYIGVYSTCFATRQQPPQHNGLHSLNLTYQVELLRSEKNRLQLAPTEYEQGEWMTIDRIHSLLNPEVVMDQALLQIIQDAAIGNSHL